MNRFTALDLSPKGILETFRDWQDEPTYQHKARDVDVLCLCTLSICPEKVWQCRPRKGKAKLVRRFEFLFTVRKCISFLALYMHGLFTPNIFICPFWADVLCLYRDAKDCLLKFPGIYSAIEINFLLRLYPILASITSSPISFLCESKAIPQPYIRKLREYQSWRVFSNICVGYRSGKKANYYKMENPLK